MIKKLTLFSVLIFTISAVNAQKANPNLEKEIIEMEIARKQRIERYLLENPQKKASIHGLDKTYDLSDVIDGHPIYVGNHNSGTSKSIGVDELRSSGSLGINITGKGMRVGVWDQRVPRQSHVEFSNRILVNEAGEVSDHATHTLGTIIARGVNSSARGMAYEATGVSYDWTDDASEMLTEASVQNLLVSNHSYGPLAGWEPSLGQWFGDASVSTQEDYKFGYYDSRAKAWDAIIVNHPYYTIVKSAGNDRTDSGNGTFPPDGSFDIIATYGTAKNIITVGAVQKTPNGVTSPSDIVMSSFSSWGPTDDGRIKPDIVAPGVSILSTTSANDQAYSSFQGTSMSAPAVAGSCILLQQLHHELFGTYMWASSLKGLIIQTAYECGPSDGPDYQFGWGMINVEKAAEFLIQNDGINNILIEGEIKDGEVIDYELNPVAGEKITATLAWTDQPGNVPPRVLDPENLILVNDLDMRIVNEAGDEVKPWILDPASPGIAAKKGDNFRDNIEKIEFNNPEQRKYFVRIKTKGALAGGKQAYSLIVGYESENSGLTNLYWIGNSGNWEDGTNWSTSSGGSPANIVPDENSKVIFDENSFSDSDGYIVNINQNTSIGSIIWLAPEIVDLNLNNHILSTNNSSQLSQNNLSIFDGQLLLKYNDNDLTKNFSINNSFIEKIDLIIDNQNASPWIISPGVKSIDSLVIVQGSAQIISNDTLKIENILVRNSGAELNLSDLVISNIGEISIEDGNLIAENTDFIFKAGTNNKVLLSDTKVNADFIISNGNIEFSGSNDAEIANVLLSMATLSLRSDVTMDGLEVHNSTLELGEDIILEIKNNLSLLATNLGSTILRSDSKGFLNVLPHKKFCFENIVVQNVDLAGSASVSLGVNSTVENAQNWFIGSCDNLIFSNFQVLYPCVKGLAYLIDKSEGTYQNRSWLIDGETAGNQSTLYVELNSPGQKEITLSVNNGEVTSQYTQLINVVSSSLDSNFIVTNSTQLASFRTASSYQWFKDGVPIEGETSRVYLHENRPGVYFVLTFDGACNRKSSNAVLVSTSYEEFDNISIFPNPVLSGNLYVESKDNDLKPGELQIVNQLGQQITGQSRFVGQGKFEISVTNLPAGLYYLIISKEEKRNIYKFSKI